MIHKLQQKFILITMGSVTVVMLILGISINVFNFISVNSDMTRMLEMIYENQGSVPNFIEKNGPKERHNDHFTMETPFSTRYFVLKYDSKGNIASANMKNIAAVTEADTDIYLKIAQTTGEGFGFTGYYKYYVVKNGDDRYMAIFLNCYDELHSVQTTVAITVIVIAICIFLIFFLVMFFSKRAISPTIKTIEKQKQFITDAGHELKTPITVIQTSLKVLEMDTGNNKWIDKIQGQVDKLSKLVNDLVTLSRMDEEKPPLQFKKFDISSAVSEVSESFRAYALEQGHELFLEIEQESYYYGDEAAIRQLTSILIDNAVKYSDSGSEISVRLFREKRSLVLQTENKCSSLDITDTERLFDRFYRADKSRNSQTGGFGIGLSVAKSIVEAHGGTVEATSKEENIVHFTVRLKASASVFV